MNHSKLNKIYVFLNKDSKDHNESNKRVFMIRLVGIVLSLYLFSLLCFFVISGNKILIYTGMISLCGNLGILYLSYQKKSMIVYWIQSTISLLWIIFYILVLGWNCGIQHFLFLMVVLACFAIFDNSKVKIGYISFLCLLRCFLYFYCRNNEVLYLLSDFLVVTIQLISTICIFISIGGVSVIFSNYSQEAEKKLVLYNRKLELVANQDELTGLMNRRCMMKHLESYDNSGRKCTDSIAIGDIDFFKKINDQYGHECGDMVLCELSHLLEAKMKDKGKVARWGGEEFLFVFEQTNGDDALVHLWDMLRDIRNLKIGYGDLTISITMTFGLEEYDGINYEKTVRKADDKLYMGKTKGRNQIIF